MLKFLFSKNFLTKGNKMQPINNLQNIQAEYSSLQAVLAASSGDKSLQTSVNKRMQALGKQIADQQKDDWEMVDSPKNIDQKVSVPLTKANEKASTPTVITAAAASSTTAAVAQPIPQPEKKMASLRGLSVEQAKFVIDVLGVDTSAKTFQEVHKEFDAENLKFRKFIQLRPQLKNKDTPEKREAQRNLDRAFVRILLHPLFEDILGPNSESEKFNKEYINDLMQKDRAYKAWLKFEAKYLLPIAQISSLTKNIFNSIVSKMIIE